MIDPVSMLNTQYISYTQNTNELSDTEKKEVEQVKYLFKFNRSRFSASEIVKILDQIDKMENSDTGAFNIYNIFHKLKTAFEAKAEDKDAKVYLS